VFTNLVENAVKYTPKGGRIWIKATIEDPEAVVTVEDTGAGIPPAMLTQIFELFTQVDAEASQSGLGIGLAVVKDIVSLHGGSVQARSQGVGRGSEFSVRLPLQRHEKST
jgi:signal transduction histidine kinase